MAFKISLFETKRGEKPVEEFIKLQSAKTIAKIIHEIELLEKYGPFLSPPHAKKLQKNLSELRIRGREEIRILYSFKNKNIHLLHAFKKKTQKTPQKEIETALKRLDII